MKQIVENSTEKGFNVKYPSIPVLVVTKEEWFAHQDEWKGMMAIYCPEDSGSIFFMGEEFPLSQQGVSAQLDKAIAEARRLNG